MCINEDLWIDTSGIMECFLLWRAPLIPTVVSPYVASWLHCPTLPHYSSPPCALATPAARTLVVSYADGCEECPMFNRLISWNWTFPPSEQAKGRGLEDPPQVSYLHPIQRDGTLCCWWTPAFVCVQVLSSPTYSMAVLVCMYSVRTYMQCYWFRTIKQV